MNNQFETGHLNVPKNTPDFSDIKNFINQLPDTIEGSQKTYTKSSIAQTINNILFGGKSLETLTNTYGIHDVVHSYMKNRVKKAWEVLPAYKDTQFHPLTGKKIDTFEDMFRFADFLLRAHDLEPRNEALMLEGLENADPQTCTQLYQDIFAHSGGISAKFGTQTHVNFDNADTLRNAKENRNNNPRNILDMISDDYQEFVSAQLQGDQGRTREITNRVKKYLDDVAFEKISREYKFHITPPRHLLPLYIDRIMQVMQHDEFFKKNVVALKVNSIPNEFDGETGQLIPDIVIYPQRAATAQTSQALAASFLEHLKNHFSDLDGASSFVGTPRFNQQITNTLAVAQSGGDLKKQLAHMGLLDRYFTKESGYAFATSSAEHHS